MDAAAKEGGVSALATPDGDGAKFVGSQILSEHAAFVTEHPTQANEQCVQACLAYIYRELDPQKYHYHVDSSRIYVRPNEKLADADLWVPSEKMKQISEWCRNAANIKQSVSYALVGPLGTGKTSTCQHIMEDLTRQGYMIITCKLDDRSLDTTLERIIFCTNMSEKSVILLDELDSLNIKQKTSETASIIEFFAKLKASKYLSIVMSTINDPEAVHESVMERDGRIDEVIEVSFPSEDMMMQLFKSYTEKANYNIPEDVMKATVKKLTEMEVSAAGVANIVNQIFIKNGAKDVYTQEDMDLVLASVKVSREASRKTYYRRKKPAEQAIGQL